MKYMAIIICGILLSGCSIEKFFKPPPRYFYWRLNNVNKLYPKEEQGSFQRFFDRRSDDMRSCGMDDYVGESDNPEVNLCMESKGWYLKGGPVCENRIMWNRPPCIKWRSKHSKPNAKPWE